ncbi:HAMP domain-containing protein [candidate division KSB3 bacterium]|uniref:HAMP domain-containing protein n=1 Tax=candidate division KSB3 bacterium TaxID=2044937 RepID=A0A9D5Q5X2_9BACT|nr:HAMP domain-containing protein [candidate division KSB3 bacterium]MBD3324301.1 HAMP domain-containing protein [candidate division KSB3 bacterium]
MRSIGTKLALQIAVVLIVVMAIFGVFEISQQKKRFTNFLNDKEESSVRQLSLILGEFLFYMNLDPIDHLAQAYLSDKEMLSIKILEENDVLTHLAKDPETSEMLDVIQADVQPPLYTDAVVRTLPITYEDEEVGTLEVIFSRHFISAQIQETLLALSGNLLLVILVETLVVLTLARRNIVSPLNNLIHAAERIADGEIDVHLTESSARNEIGTLTRAFTRMITYLQRMADASMAIANGNLHHTVTPRSERDVLGQAFRKMAAYLNEIATTSGAMAKGDLSQAIDARSAEDALGHMLQSMTEGLRSLILQIRTSVEHLVAIETGISRLTTDNLNIVQEGNVSVKAMIATVRKLAASVEDVAEKMEVLSSSVEETSASVTQMAPSITHIVSNTQALTQQITHTRTFLNETVDSLETIVARADDSKQLSQETIQDALNGQQAMEQVMTSMEVLQTTIRTTVDAITSFSERSKNIGTILDVIGDVTDQTSLLALNASIIAAQAGEHGRGFAIVAEEIKSLAQGVTTSTKDIAEIVRTLQQETDNVVRTVHEGVSNVEQGMERTQQAQATLQKILSSAQRSSQVVTEMSDALRQLMTNTHSVADAMEKVKAMTDEIYTATNEQEISTKQINQAITHMNELASLIQQSTTYQASGLQEVLQTTTNVTQLIDQNSASSQKITQETQDLAAQADLLSRSVVRFKLKA